MDRTDNHPNSSSASVWPRPRSTIPSATSSSARLCALSAARCSASPTVFAIPPQLVGNPICCQDGQDTLIRWTCAICLKMLFQSHNHQKIKFLFWKILGVFWTMSFTHIYGRSRIFMVVHGSFTQFHAVSRSCFFEGSKNGLVMFWMVKCDLVWTTVNWRESPWITVNHRESPWITVKHRESQNIIPFPKGTSWNLMVPVVQRAWPLKQQSQLSEFRYFFSTDRVQSSLCMHHPSTKWITELCCAVGIPTSNASVVIIN